MTPHPVLVTGGAGFIGSHVVEALLARGARVRVLDSLDPQVHGPGRTKPPWLPEQVEVLHGSVTDRDLVSQALRGVRAVVHLAAVVGVGQSMYEVARYVENNVQGTAVLLDTMVNGRSEVARLVVASSMSIYGEGRYRCSNCGPIAPGLRPLAQLQARDWEMSCPSCRKAVDWAPTDEEKPIIPTSVYAVTKRDQEELCLCVGRAYGVPAVALRLFNVYGPRQSLSNPYTGIAAIFSSRLLNNQPPLIFEDGLQSRDFIHVSDVAEAFCLALDKTHVADMAINIGTGRATTVSQMAALVGRAIGVSRPAEIVGKFREGDIRHCVAGNDRARDLLGFSPKVPLENGMADLAQWAAGSQADDHVARARDELEARGLIR